MLKKPDAEKVARCWKNCKTLKKLDAEKIRTTSSLQQPCVVPKLVICTCYQSFDHKAWPKIGGKVHFSSLSPCLDSGLLTIFHLGWKNALRLKFAAHCCIVGQQKKDHTRTNTIAKLFKSSWVQVCIQVGLFTLAKLGYVETKNC